MDHTVIIELSWNFGKLPKKAIHISISGLFEQSVKLVCSAYGFET